MYSFDGAYSWLLLPMLDLGMHSLDSRSTVWALQSPTASLGSRSALVGLGFYSVGVYGLGVYGVSVCSLQLPILDLRMHSWDLSSAV